MNFKSLAVIIITAFFTLNMAIAANNLTQSNPQTLEWLIVLNKNEIAAANEVLKRNPLNPQVKQFAQFMVSQHTQLLKDTLKIDKQLKDKPVISEAATTLQNQGKEELSHLKALDAQQIQKPYIDAMVKGHAEALVALQQFIPEEHNTKVKNLLTVTKNHVAMHLEKAKQVKDELKF